MSPDWHAHCARVVMRAVCVDFTTQMSMLLVCMQSQSDMQGCVCCCADSTVHDPKMQDVELGKKMDP